MQFEKVRLNFFLQEYASGLFTLFNDMRFTYLVIPSIRTEKPGKTKTKPTPLCCVGIDIRKAQRKIS